MIFNVPVEISVISNQYNEERNLVKRFEQLKESGSYIEQHNLVEQLTQKGEAYVQANINKMNDSAPIGFSNTNNQNKEESELQKKIEELTKLEKYDEIYKLVKPLADKGDALGQANLGDLYYHGKVVKKDYKEAIKYYKLAADQGNTTGQFCLACMYREGEGVTKNVNEAIRYFKLAADQGDVDAQAELGYMYYYKENGVQDYSKALKYLKLAADQGDIDSQIEVGKIYEEGLGVEKNENEAIKYYKLAADQGDSIARDALTRLGQTNDEPQEQSDGCFITTAVCDSFNKPDNCYELTMFRNFRDNWLINEIDGKELIKEYYNNAPKIVDSINSRSNKSEIYLNIWNTYLKACLQFIENKKYSECKDLYIQMVRNLEKKFLF